MVYIKHRAPTLDEGTVEVGILFCERASMTYCVALYCCQILRTTTIFLRFPGTERKFVPSRHSPGGNRSPTLEPRHFFDGPRLPLMSLGVSLELDGTGISFPVQARLRPALPNASFVRHRPYQRLLLATLHQRPDFIIPMQATTERLVLIGDILEMIAEKLEACSLSPLPQTTPRQHRCFL